MGSFSLHPSLCLSLSSQGNIIRVKVRDGWERFCGETTQNHSGGRVTGPRSIPWECSYLVVVSVGSCHFQAKVLRVNTNTISFLLSFLASFKHTYIGP